MNKYINLYLIEYTINALLRDKFKTIFLTFIMTALIFILSSLFLITNSIKHELNLTLHSLPQIIVQNVKGGRSYDIDTNLTDKLLNIRGVSDAIARVWGYYYFRHAGVNLTLVGIGEFDNEYTKSLQNIANNFHFEAKPSMIIGKGVNKIMKNSYYNKYFNFIKPNGGILKVNIAGVFDKDIELESNDMIVMSNDTLRKIVNMPEDRATDIVVKVANPKEINTVIAKIKDILPSARVISNNDIKMSYQNIFDYKSGLFLAFFVISIFTFFIIVYDKVSGLSSEQKREIGILKALGWKIDDILKEKFYEGFIISFFSYFVGEALAFAYVYIFQAPLLKNIFIGYSDLKPEFHLPFFVDTQTLFLIFFLSVPIYIGATIIPSWRVATLDADEVIR